MFSVPALLPFRPFRLLYLSAALEERVASRISGVRTRWVAAFPWVERAAYSRARGLGILGEVPRLAAFPGGGTVHMV